MIFLHTITNYSSALFELLKKLECLDKVNGDLKPYYDSEQYVTVGIGFNIEGNPLALNAVLRALGIDPNRGGLSTDGVAAENYYISKIKAELSQNYENSLGLPDNDKLQEQLNKIMAARAIDSRLSTLPADALRTEFKFNSADEVRTAYDQLIPHYEQLVLNWLIANGIDFAVSDLQYQDTNEHAVLVSLAWKEVIG